MAFVSLCCDRNTNDAISTRKNARKHSTLPCVSTKNFFRLKWRHSRFYPSTEIRKQYIYIYIRLFYTSVEVTTSSPGPLSSSICSTSGPSSSMLLLTAEESSSLPTASCSSWPNSDSLTCPTA